MIEDPIETEQWLAFNAYLCFCSAWGSFMAAVQAAQLFLVYIDELFYIGFAFTACGFVLLALADFKVPTQIWRYVIRNRLFWR